MGDGTKTEKEKKYNNIEFVKKKKNERREDLDYSLKDSQHNAMMKPQ